MLLCQLYHHWKHYRLSLWKPLMMPVLPKFPSWWASVWSVMYSTKASDECDIFEFYRLSWRWKYLYHHIDSLEQGCSNSSALAMKLLQSCTEPSILFALLCAVFLRDTVMLRSTQTSLLTAENIFSVFSCKYFVHLSMKLMIINTPVLLIVHIWLDHNLTLGRYQATAWTNDHQD